MRRALLVLLSALIATPVLAIDGRATATVTADSFSLDEPIIIELVITGVGGLDGYVVTSDPPAANPPMGLYNSSEAGYGFPIVRGVDRNRPLRHRLLLNKWMTFDHPGRYNVTIDSLVGVKRYVTSVEINVVERDEARLQQSCTLWGERANGRSLEQEEGEYSRGGPRGQKAFARIVLMFMQRESLIPCLLQSASKENLAPAIAFREMDSVAAVHALQQLMRSPVPELSDEARKRLGQLQERTRKKNVRKAAADALNAATTSPLSH